MWQRALWLAAAALLAFASGSNEVMSLGGGLSEESEAGTGRRGGVILTSGEFFMNGLTGSISNRAGNSEDDQTMELGQGASWSSRRRRTAKSPTPTPTPAKPTPTPAKPTPTPVKKAHSTPAKSPTPVKAQTAAQSTNVGRTTDEAYEAGYATGIAASAPKDTSFGAFNATHVNEDVSSDIACTEAPNCATCKAKSTRPQKHMRCTSCKEDHMFVMHDHIDRTGMCFKPQTYASLNCANLAGKADWAASDAPQVVCTKIVQSTQKLIIRNMQPEAKAYFAKAMGKNDVGVSVCNVWKQTECMGGNTCHVKKRVACEKVCKLKAHDKKYDEKECFTDLCTNDEKLAAMACTFQAMSE